MPPPAEERLAARPGGRGRAATARAGGLAAIPLLAMTAVGLAGGPAAVAEPGRPATVAVAQVPGAADPACAGCGDRRGSTLKLRLRPLAAGGLIVRVFLDKPGADVSSSTEDPAYAGSLVLSAAAAGPTAQEFLLPLPRSARFLRHRRATIVIVPIDRAAEATGSVSVEGAALLAF